MAIIHLYESLFLEQSLSKSAKFDPNQMKFSLVFASQIINSSFVKYLLGCLKKMPNNEEHCKHSLKLYRVEGKEIHRWLDEPSRHYGGIHRGFRHDEKTIILAGKVFGKNYGEAMAQNIALTHIMADHEESIKKRNEKKGVVLSEIKAYEEEKPKYEKKKKELKKLLKDELELPEIITDKMRVYLDVHLASKGPEIQKLADISLRHWQKYLLSWEGPNRVIKIEDVTRYISNLQKKVSIRTTSSYLGQLENYFGYQPKKKELADYVNKKMKELAKEIVKIEKNFVPMRHRDISGLYQRASLADKILIRLLLLEKLPIRCLEEISVRQYSNGEYEFSIGKEKISINEETIKIAKPRIEKNIKKSDNKLLGFSTRQIQKRIRTAGEKINLLYKVSPKDLRRFGKNHHPADLMEILSSN